MSANYEESNEGGPDDLELPEVLLRGGEGTDTLRLEFAGATVFGTVPETVGVHWSGGGNFGMSLVVGEDGYGLNAPAASATGVGASVMSLPGPALYAVSVSATDWADSFSGGPGDEWVNLFGGDDMVFLSGGADRVATGDGADRIEINRGYVGSLGGTIGGTVTDFEVGRDVVQLVGFDRDDLAFTEVAGVGTRIQGVGDAAGAVDVTLLGVFGYGDFLFV